MKQNRKSPSVLFLLGCLIINSASHSHHHHIRNLIENNDGSDDVPHRTCGTPEATEEGRFLQQRALSIAQASQKRRMLPIVVPVCFHVITDTDDNGRLTAEQLQDQLDALNNAYGSTSCCDESLSWCDDSSCSIDTGFTFAMAAMDDEGNILEDGTTYPNVTDEGACVTYTANDAWFSSGIRYEYAMKSSLRKGDANVLNTYFHNLYPYLGYAYMPWDGANDLVRDGVVCLYSSLPGGAADPFDEGDTLVHEVGHWLGLYHTFEGGCSTSDGIPDTPAEAAPYYGCVGSSRDTCPFDTGVDPIHNFMDYADDVCMYKFTYDQVSAMQAAWEVYRSGEYTGREDIQLTKGVWSDPIYLTTGETQVFTLDISGEEGKVNCRLSGDEGDADLYVTLDSRPTFTDSDFCVSTSSNSNERCGNRRTCRWPYPLSLFFCRLFDWRPVSTATTLYAGVLAHQMAMDLEVKCG